MQVSLPVTVAIPTYQREQVLIDTIDLLLQLDSPPSEILVLDQTDRHDPETARQLGQWHEDSSIRWLRFSPPSIPKAMNTGLLEARNEIVLFIDDDIIPDKEFVAAHYHAQASHDLIAGMVLQPGETAIPKKPGKFAFRQIEPEKVNEFMGGNFSVKRNVALTLGGFDENFIGAAYRFEAEFAHRYVLKHGSIQYEPKAKIHHLQAKAGGTRAHGHHLRTARPSHTVGAYYYLLRSRPEGWRFLIARRAFRAVRTRHHLRRPWWIPITLLSEIRGLNLALGLHRSGPALIKERPLI